MFDSDVRNRDIRTTSFDKNGQTSQKFTEFDSGILRVENYEYGQRAQILQYDAPQDDGRNGVASWAHIEDVMQRDSIQTTYDTAARTPDDMLELFGSGFGGF